MKVPQILNDVMATYIGIETINGVHYYNILKEEKEKIDQSVSLQNIFSQIQDGIYMLNKREVNGGVIVEIDPELCEMTSKAQIEKISERYEEFAQIKDFIDINKSKEKEAKMLAEEINQRKTDFDVYLYKMKGLRRKVMPVTVNGEKYKKVINGYRLTLSDIEKVNLYAAKYGYKITKIQECEMLDREEGLRVVLTIGKADIIS